MEKKILVLLKSSAKELKSVHYALSLAERLQAQVFILQQGAWTGLPSGPQWLQEALADLINSARQAGLTVSHHIAAGGDLEQDLMDFVNNEVIDVFVFGEHDGLDQGFLSRFRRLVTSQIIEVKEKHHIRHLAKKG